MRIWWFYLSGEKCCAPQIPLARYGSADIYHPLVTSLILTRCTKAQLLFVFFLLAASLREASAASHLAAPIALRCEGQSSALAVAETLPEFSWKLKVSREELHGVRQSEFEVRVAGRDEDLAEAKNLIWDSGELASDQESVRPESKTAGRFAPGEEYVWQVRVWDEGGQPSNWSKPAHFSVAPMWRAKWIAADATDADAGLKPMPLFRKSFNLSGRVKRAVLYISGLGQYEARIDGSRVGSAELAPGWSNYRKTIFYDSFDVTSLLHPGANALGIMLGNGMYRVPVTPHRYTKFTGTFGPPKAVAQLEIELTNGEKIEIVTDGTWKAHSGPIVFSSTYGGEDFDARNDPEGWDQTGFDDSDWAGALVTAGPGGEFRPELSPAIKVMHTYEPVRRTEPKPGVAVYDLGQNFAGWPAITVRGVSGTTVKLIPGELLEPDGTVSQHSSGGPQWFSYTLKGRGLEIWHPRFSYYGFRYVQVETTSEGGGAGQAVVVSLKGEAVHTSSETVGSFESSDELLNRIHTLIVRAIENNAVSLFTDCPHREKLGWLEEAHLLASAMLYDFDFEKLYAATAQNIADAQNGDGPIAGRVPEIAPQYVVFGVDGGIFDDSPEWGSTAVLAPWYVYQRTGNLKQLLDQADVMKRYVDYLSTRAKANIITYGLGDWYDIGPGEPGVSKLTTPGVTATAIYYQDLRVLVEVMKLAGKGDESRKYAEKANEVKRDFNARFWDNEHHRYDKGSQTAQAMPLVVGLAPVEERGHVLEALVEDIRGHNNHVTAGDVGFHYVVDALMDGDRSDVLYDMLERTDSPSYGYQLAKGATALTEAWDANPDSSQDHFMLGHAEEWFYRGLGGIRIDMQAAPADRITLEPQLVGSLRSVHTRYESSWGPIESNWTRGTSTSEYDFAIPVNTTATVKIKSTSPREMEIDNKRPEQSPGVIKSQVDGNAIVLVLGSGHYRISAPNPNGMQ